MSRLGLSVLLALAVFAPVGGLAWFVLGNRSLAGSASATTAPVRWPAAPVSVPLTPEERRLWRPVRPYRDAVPVIAYHGVTPKSGRFSVTPKHA
ncbi:MAG: hypothetical protein HYX33_02800 [Actinobacteria bacterium]|nr:hypothetical protein [Actinomycetota bacterium]